MTTHTSDTTHAVLARWREMAEAATEGPWHFRENHREIAIPLGMTGWLPLFSIHSLQVEGLRDSSKADTDFVIESRTALPVLLDVVTQMREALTYLSDNERTKDLKVTTVNMVAADVLAAIDAALNGADDDHE